MANATLRYQQALSMSTPLQIYSSFRRFKPDFDYLLPLRLPYFAPLRETKTVVHLPEIRCNFIF